MQWLLCERRTLRVVPTVPQAEESACKQGHQTTGEQHATASKRSCVFKCDHGVQKLQVRGAG